MPGAIAILFSLQLAGELLARSLSLPVPGPVIGLALLVLLFRARPDLAAYCEGTARSILAHMSLLFVPAGVGVISNLDLLIGNWLAISVVLAASTLISMLVSVAVFLSVVQVSGGGND